VSGLVSGTAGPSRRSATPWTTSPQVHKSTHATETVYRYVIVLVIWGGATGIDDVFGDISDEDGPAGTAARVPCAGYRCGERWPTPAVAGSADCRRTRRRGRRRRSPHRVLPARADLAPRVVAQVVGVTINHPHEINAYRDVSGGRRGPLKE
jgi:hypothetical protein